MLPSVFLTLPFQSEFQIPQVQIPHPNFPSHPNLRTLTHLSRTPKEIRRPVTGYRAPVRIRSAAWSSASPDGREVGRLAAVHPIVGLLLVCASRTSSSRSSTTRTPEVHIAGTVDIDAPLHRTGGASYRFARTSRRCAHFSLISASEVIIACGQVGPALVHPHPVRGAHRRHAHRTFRDTEEESHAVALSLGLGLERKPARG